MATHAVARRNKGGEAGAAARGAHASPKHDHVARSAKQGAQQVKGGPAIQARPKCAGHTPIADTAWLQRREPNEQAPTTLLLKAEPGGKNLAEPPSDYFTPRFRRKSGGGGAIADLPETKVQPKLKLAPPDNAYERQADELADKVMRMPEKVCCSGCAAGKTCDEHSRTLPGETETDEAFAIRRLPAAAGAGIAVPVELETEVRRLQHGGEPVPDDLRAKFEPKLGNDLSKVRIHHDAAAAYTADIINAKAFTIGRDIAFGHGQYNAHSAHGQQLLAHELAHVLQQSDFHAAPAHMEPTPRQLIHRMPADTTVQQRNLLQQSSTHYKLQETEKAPADLSTIGIITHLIERLRHLDTQISFTKREAAELNALLSKISTTMPNITGLVLTSPALLIFILILLLIILSGSPVFSPGPAEQIRRVIEEIVRRIKKNLAREEPIPLTPEVTREPCTGVEVERSGGYPPHDAYATQITGRAKDYWVKTPNGLACKFDGIQRMRMRLWEVKTGYKLLDDNHVRWSIDTPKWHSIMRKLEEQRARCTKVAKDCGYTYSYAFDAEEVAEAFKLMWPDTNVNWIPRK